MTKPRSNHASKGASKLGDLNKFSVLLTAISSKQNQPIAPDDIHADNQHSMPALQLILAPA